MVSVFADAEEPTSPEPVSAITAMAARYLRWNFLVVDVFMVPVLFCVVGPPPSGRRRAG